MERHWQGSLWLARDYCLFAGASGSTECHAHYAHQAMLALDGPLRLSLAGSPLEASRVLIQSLQPHAFADARQPLLAVYAEPQAYSRATLEAVLEAARPNLDDLALHMAQAPRQALDPRIARALQALDEQLAEKISASALASRASLSLSQLERLFGEQVGLSVRRLVLWRRLRLALAMALEGQGLTAAAHAAGFADSAHFSRTVRSMFGIRADRTLRHLQLRVLD